MTTVPSPNTSLSWGTVSTLPPPLTWEPGVMPYQLVGIPRIGQTDDGHALVPATAGLVEVEASP